ncbi:exonuclease domain-containing protein [Cytobacillus solani]|uniref:Exonuclease n=1 Tax=Cytobacillus solani TaxID=1637975 RepID=A0A0Q3QU40_9BACI|nr:exonuclease domain-containing protein [Cytobacillus solani]KOP79871.1 exonuclease [Bacillus sp. FJAT-21945]KQL21254.1 exonuclease [Cytobacillus solani]
MDFITIDFEIANNHMNSACSLGMVFIQNNKIIDEKYYLIQPPTLELDQEMSKIHGLSFDDLKNAPKFDEVWGEISHYFHNESLFVAHNAQFDMNVLRNCLKTYSIEVPEFDYVCSIPISTRACSGEGIGSSLKDRAERFGITLNNHHNALDDARACAELVLKCMETKRRKSIHTYISTYSSIPIKRFSELKIQTEFKKRKKNFAKISTKDMIPSTNDFDIHHPFYSKNFVFTGELTMDREEAMQRVVNLGGIIKSGVSSKTNYLVVGKQDHLLVGSSGLSSKERKAYELIEAGRNIEILTETKFRKLLDCRLILTSIVRKKYVLN